MKNLWTKGYARTIGPIDTTVMASFSVSFGMFNVATLFTTFAASVTLERI